MSILKKGTQVRLVQPVIVGEVIEATIIDGEVQYRVEYRDANGDTQERFFPAEQIEPAA